MWLFICFTINRNTIRLCHSCLKLGSIFTMSSNRMTVLSQMVCSPFFRDEIDMVYIGNLNIYLTSIFISVMLELRLSRYFRVRFLLTMSVIKYKQVVYISTTHLGILYKNVIPYKVLKNTISSINIWWLFKLIILNKF